MYSAEYDTLSRVVAHLKATLLNFLPSPTIPYSAESLLKCQAFVVFCHAEFQVYCESIARRMLNEAETRWKSLSQIDRVACALVAFRGTGQVSVPIDPSRPHDGGNLASAIERAISSQYKAIADNNGIKRSNIASLFTPLGLLPGDFSETMLIQLDQTGKKRGELVHKSSSISVRTIRDPFTDESADIENLLTEIGLFDEMLRSLGLLS